MALLPALRFAKLKLRDKRHGVGVSFAIGGGIGYAAPTDVRVEAIADGVTIIRWTPNAAGVTQVYRSTDGVTFSFLATIPLGFSSYVDSDLPEKTRFWYKLTADFGNTFSSTVTVVTYLITRGRGVSNQTAFNPYDSTGLAEQLRVWHTQTSHSPGSGTTCDLCIQLGALVIDCSTGCDWFKVIVDQDINSISIIGCPQCPNVEFVIPPNVTRKICGWPQGCDYHGDECFDAPIEGGPNGKTCKSDGSCSDGYGQPSAGSPSSKPTQSCECQSPLDRTPSNPIGCVTDCLRIQCCSDNCQLDCGDTVKLKACGGRGPYTWSNTGAGVLSSTTGAAVSVTKKKVAGLLPSTIAFLKQLVFVLLQFADNGPCTGGRLSNASWSGGKGTSYNCDGDIISTSAGSSLPQIHIHGSAACTQPPLDITTTFDASGNNGANFSPDGASGTINFDVTLAAQNSAGGSFSGSGATSPTGFTLKNVPIGGMMDFRTDAMIANGCCAEGFEGAETATVTDAAGVSVTVVLHA